MASIARRMRSAAQLQTTYERWRAATPSLQNDRVESVRYGNDIVCWLPPWFRRTPISYRATSVNTGIFKCIKDHGSYVDCNEELPAAWFE